MEYEKWEFDKWLKNTVDLANEYRIEEKIKDLPEGDEVELNQEDFFSLLHIAVDNDDRKYFEELVERQNKL